MNDKIIHVYNQITAYLLCKVWKASIIPVMESYWWKWSDNVSFKTFKLYPVGAFSEQCSQSANRTFSTL